MKTLSEEINEVLNSKETRTAKRYALAKLGLMKSDVTSLLPTCRSQSVASDSPTPLALR